MWGVDAHHHAIEGMSSGLSWFSLTTLVVEGERVVNVIRSITVRVRFILFEPMRVCVCVSLLR